MPNHQLLTETSNTGNFTWVDPPPAETMMMPETSMTMGQAPPPEPRAFSDRPLVYLAAPYANPDPVANTADTIHFAEYLMSEGSMTVHVPHLTLLWHLVHSHDVEYWYAFDLAILRKCDALFRWDNGPSSGADREVEFALDHGLPVFREEGALLEWAARR